MRARIGPQMLKGRARVRPDPREVPAQARSGRTTRSGSRIVKVVSCSLEQKSPILLENIGVHGSNNQVAEAKIKLR
jgi:hypothetical protein